MNLLYAIIRLMTLFPAFFDRPDRMRFEGQEEDEVIELLLRQHFITNLPWIFNTLLLVILPGVVFPARVFLTGLGADRVPSSIYIAAAVLWYLLVLAYIITHFLHWYFNIYIVTNKHLVDIDFSNLLSRDKTEVRLDDVQSAKSSLHGIFGSAFNFGDVVVETAAEKQDVAFIAVPQPDVVVERIQGLQELQEDPSTSLRVNHDVA